MSSWSESFIALLDHRLTNEREVYEALNNIYVHMVSKSYGKNASKKIWIPNEQAKMIDKFVKVYFSNATPSKICQTKIMRKFIKNNGSNDENLHYIYPRLVTIEMNTWNIANEEIKYDPTVKAWIRDYLATTLDPKLTMQQSYFYSCIPLSYHEYLLRHKEYIVAKIKEAIANHWLTKRDIQEIITKLETGVVIVIDYSPPFAKESIVDFIVHCYQRSINAAGMHGNIFKQIYIIGLYILNQLDLVPPPPDPSIDLKAEVDQWLVD